MKRLLAIIMTLLLATTVFTACGKQKSAGEVNTANLDKIVGDYQVVANEE